MSKDNNSPNLDAVLAHLADVVDSRRADLAAGKVDPKSSYIAQLFSKGDDAILKKIGEEATEAVMAAKDSRNANLASEQQALLVGEMAGKTGEIPKGGASPLVNCLVRIPNGRNWKPIAKDAE